MTATRTTRAANPTVRIGAVRALAESWRTTSMPGSDRHNCALSLAAVLDAALEPVDVAVVRDSRSRR